MLTGMEERFTPTLVRVPAEEMKALKRKSLPLLQSSLQDTLSLMIDTRIDKMVRLRDHFISFGNPPHLALLKAEKKMIDDGDLIDHEAIAKIQREEEERLKIEKQKVEELSEKNAKRQRATKNSYSATEGGDAHTKNFQQGSYGTSYAPAAGGRVDVQTGGFQQRAAGGYVDTRTGTFHQDAAGGTVNTQTGAFTPGN
jgi:hypothetical protein